jgi:hypothetical protein
MSVYAKTTSVSVDKSRAEIERTLSRYGASAFAYATSNDKAMIQFQADNRRIMFVLELPNKQERRFTHTRGGKGSSEWYPDHQHRLWEQACRQIWRAMALLIKAKLESVDAGITIFENEFMANIIMPGGKTVGDHMRPKIEEAYKTNKLPALTFNGMDSK